MPSEFPNKLNIPLFMITRNRIKFFNYDKYRKYMNKQRKLYSCPELTEDDIECLREMPPEKIVKKCLKKVTYLTRDASKFRPWHLPPNRYTVPKMKSPYEMKGAFWSQLKLISNQQKILHNFKFYETPRGIDRYSKSCLKHSGVFKTDPRNRRPSSRFMVTDTATCFRDPKDPGPATYYPTNYTLSAWLSKIKYKKPIIYKFLPNSCVPMKEMSIHAHISPSAAGPGRYERLEIACPCASRYLFDPRIFIEYEIQKMRKFRRLKYKKIPFNRYCGPTSVRNIFGHGHTYLFRKNVLVEEKIQRKTGKADKENKDKFFHSAKYFHSITSPTRVKISYPLEPIVERPIKIRYDRLAKRITRRQLRDNKKIAFLSGCPRFKDADTPVKLKDFKPDKGLNFPLPNISEIKSRLTELPMRFRSKYNETRIKPFQFAPLPPLKTLVRESEVKLPVDENVKFLQKPIRPEEFFKSEFL